MNASNATSAATTSYLGLRVGRMYHERGTRPALPSELEFRGALELANGAYVVGARREDAFVVLVLDDEGVVSDSIERAGAWQLTAMCDADGPVVGLVAPPCPGRQGGGTWEVRDNRLVSTATTCECIDDVE